MNGIRTYTPETYEAPHPAGSLSTRWDPLGIRGGDLPAVYPPQYSRPGAIWGFGAGRSPVSRAPPHLFKALGYGVPHYTLRRSAA